MKHITLMILFLCTPLVAFKNIEMHKKEITAVLQKNNPPVVAAFNQLCMQYDQLVIAFFDTHNNLSLAHHIKHMEDNLAVLEKTSSDRQFSSVRTLLLDLNDELQNLVMLLKQYCVSKNFLELAFKVRRFKKLLPDPINKKTEIALFWSLSHRLHC